jgi:hypothetical protein
MSIKISYFVHLRQFSYFNFIRYIHSDATGSLYFSHWYFPAASFYDKLDLTYESSRFLRLLFVSVDVKHSHTQADAFRQLTVQENRYGTAAY